MSDSNSSVRKSFRASLRHRFGIRPGGGDASSSPSSPASPSPHSTRSPLANRSEPTRRPIHEPPPPYTEVAESAATSSRGIPAAPSTSQPPARASAATTAPVIPGGATTFPIRPASPTPSNRSASSRLTAENIRSAEDPYAFLTMFDTIFVIDDSGSMAGRPWREVQAVLANITPICTQRDVDGIDIYFLNHRSNVPPQHGNEHGGPGPEQPRVPPGKAAGGYHNVRDAAAVGRIFQTVKPGGATPTGIRLHTILQPYLRYYEAKRQEIWQRGEYGDPDPEDIKPVNMIVITDGVPTDDLEHVLLNAAKKLDAVDAPPYQVGVQFFQVGSEPEAATYLKHLDDTLGAEVPGGVRDIVDTVTWDAFVRRNHGGGGGSSGGGTTALALTADGILKAVLGAVVKRLDRQPTGPAAASRQSNVNSRRHLSVT